MRGYGGAPGGSKRGAHCLAALPDRGSHRRRPLPPQLPRDHAEPNALIEELAERLREFAARTDDGEDGRERRERLSGSATASGRTALIRKGGGETD